MKYGLIGEKLGHSFSKDIHEKIGGYEYELVQISRNELECFMTKHNFFGINVTIPYKQDVIPYIDELSDRAKEIGAVNTVVNRNGKLYGDNTDFLGMRALILKSGTEIYGKKVLILGTGGTSKTASAVAKSMGASEIYRVSRTSGEGAITYSQAKENHSDADVIINTTPCGMYPDNFSLPIDLETFKNLSGVIDAIYNPLNSYLVTEAKKRGVKASGGLYMLVSQAVYAAERFLGKQFDEKLTDNIYSKILLKKQNIVLTGMPGSGKSTVGKILSKELDKHFVDTDEYITKKYGKSPAEIISTMGESKFRDIESEAVCEVSLESGQIIATGGGAVLREKNILALKGNGKIFFIDRPIDDIIPTDDRPLSSTKEDIIRRYKERYDIYKNTSDVIVPVTGDAMSVASYIEENLK